MTTQETIKTVNETIELKKRCMIHMSTQQEIDIAVRFINKRRKFITELESI